MFEQPNVRRPFKIWNCSRTVRKSIVVGSFEELLDQGKVKLDIPASESVEVVLECNGSKIRDYEHLRTVENDTVLIFLRQQECWEPSVDWVKGEVLNLPLTLCETVQSLNLHRMTPSWKVVQNSGLVTVILHWNRCQDRGYEVPSQSSRTQLRRSRRPTIDHTSSQILPRNVASSAGFPEMLQRQERIRRLLLIDKLSDDHKRFLSLSDIGAILKSLKSKITEVSDLLRYRKSNKCYHWIIYASVVNDEWGELGIVYDNVYYDIRDYVNYMEFGDNNEREIPN